MNPYPYGMPPGVPFGGVPGMPPGYRPMPMQVLPPALVSSAPAPRPLAAPPTLPKPSGAPIIVSPAPRLGPTAGITKNCTLYVGKIAPTVDNKVIKALLDACGTVKSWKRVEDTETGKPKPFGFCEYEDAEGVLMALSNLNELALDGQELLLKPNSSTQAYIEDYKARKAREAAVAKEDKMEDGEEAKEEGTEAADTAANRENEVLERIMAIVSDHSALSTAQYGAAHGAAAAADQFLNGLRSEGDHGRTRKPAHGASERAHRAEGDMSRERERERELEARKRQELERAYLDTEKSWTRHERQMREAAEKEQEALRQAIKERLRHIRADAEAIDSDGEDEPWARKPIADSRRSQARRRKREQEVAQDNTDRDREHAELAAKRQKSDAEMSGVRAEQDGMHASSGQENAPDDNHVDVNDPIYQAMVSAAKAAQALPPPPSLDAHTMEQERLRQLAQQPEALTPSAPSPAPAREGSQDTSAQRSSAARRKPSLSVFGEEEEEDKPKRKLIKLQYTEEEQRAMEAAQKQKAADEAAAAAAASAEGAAAEGVKPPKDKDKAIKELIKSIPRERKDVFAYSLKWDAFDANADAILPKLSKWVLRKTVEVLGQEEPSMVDYVMSLVKQHSSPAQMVDTLQAIMDNETDPFVLNLFRLIIMESEKAAKGLL